MVLQNFASLFQIVALVHSSLFSLKHFETETFSYSVKYLNPCEMKHQISWKLNTQLNINYQTQIDSATVTQTCM